MTKNARSRAALMYTRVVSGALGVAMLVWGTGLVQAAPKAPPRPTLDLKATAAQLQSGDQAAITTALTAMRGASQAAGPLVPAVERLLDRGAPNPVAKLAIETLADVGQTSSSASIAKYARHRDVELRRTAVTALRRTRGPDAVSALKTALSDSDNRVRSAAASGLGSLNAVEAMDDLFRALDHKVLEAAAAIGQICKGDACDKLVSRAGKLPLIVLTSGVDQLLFRSALDVPDDQKIKIIGDIRELGTQEVHRYLTDVLGRWSPAGSPRVKAAIEQAANATRNSPGDVKKEEGGSP
ncbi:MAG: HEAT repeat domain-containing protein [Polyangiaceae bacterium]